MYRIWLLLFGLPFVIGAQQPPALPLFFVANNGQAPKSVRFLTWDRVSRFTFLTTVPISSRRIGRSGRGFPDRNRNPYSPRIAFQPRSIS